MEQKEFYCPLYDGMIKKYDCDEISYGAESGRYINDGLPYLMPIEDVLSQRERCLNCERQMKNLGKYNLNDRYYASEDRLAVYRIDEEYNGYYINASLLDWVKDQDVLRVPFSTTENDRIGAADAKAILEKWGKDRALKVFSPKGNKKTGEDKQMIAAVNGKDLNEDTIHDLAMLIQQTVMENNVKRK